MSLILTLIVGGFIGWLAASIGGRDYGIIGNILVGIAGAFIGGVFANVLGFNDNFLLLSWSGFLWSLLGAVILVSVLNALQSGSTKHDVEQ